MASIFSRSKHRDQQAVAPRSGYTRSPSTQSTSSQQQESSLSQSAERSTSSKSLRSTFCARLVKVDDEELAAMALDTKLRIDWRSVVLSARIGPARWRRVHVLGDFAVYTRQESQRFGVLAVGVVPGCVAEVVNVLQSPNSTQFAQHMQGVFEDQFREGSYVHRVDVAHQHLTDRTCRHDGSELAELSVKTVTFNKASWLANHEEWCYVDSIYRHGDATKNGGAVEKFLTTMQPKDIIAGLSGCKTKYFHDVVCGYLLRPGADDGDTTSSSSSIDADSTKPKKPSSTRVTFYAEFQSSKTFAFPLGGSSRRSSMAASDKTIKQRLVKLAGSTARLTALVRRQRLGLQVLVDGNRFVPPLNVPCKVCTNVLLVAKQCRLCGHAVCSDCSAMHERARQPRRSQRVEIASVRVCARCIERVDGAAYANLSSSSLLGSHVLPDPVGTKSAAVMLRELLQDALLSAPSPTRKACVMSVIKCVLNQEAETERSTKGSFVGSTSSGSATPVLLTPMSSDYDIVKAMDFMEVDVVVDVRSDESRIYQIDSAGTDAAVPTPVPENEAERLRAVNRVSVSELAASAELEILCDVAAKEMGCMSSTIAIIDTDTFHVVASNTPELRRLALPRESSMCSHTIMEKSPLIVKHPEADIRFSKFDSVDTFGVRYYCAFPLMGENDQIIGAMCCINSETMDITTSQFAAFKKLTTTASKVVRMQTTKRMRKLSTASSTASSETSGDGDMRVAPSA